MHQKVNGVLMHLQNSLVMVRLISFYYFFLRENCFLFKDEHLWKQYDAMELVASYHGPNPHAPVLIDQGSDDNFKDKYLFPDRFLDACKKASFPIELREQDGYDHSYYFIMTFLEDHFKYHKKEFEHSQ
jgi:S-formylglutathione hydrolase